MTYIDAVSGVGPSAAKTLIELHITTAELLAVQDPEVLQRLSKLGEGTTRKIIENARDLVGTFCLRDGLEHEIRELVRARLSTGIEKLDKRLNGGIEAGSVVEFYGPARGGKTHWCHQLLTRALLPLEEGGLGKNALWIGVHSRLRTNILKAMMLRFDMDHEVEFRRIYTLDVLHKDQLESLMKRIGSLIVERDIGIIVLDCISPLYAFEYMGMANRNTIHYELFEFINRIREVLMATGAIFVYTNQVMEKILVTYSASNQPLGEDMLAHFPDYRFYTSTPRRNHRVLRLKDHVSFPEFEEKLTLGWGGFYQGRDELEKNEETILGLLHEQPKKTVEEEA